MAFQIWRNLCQKHRSG